MSIRQGNRIIANKTTPTLYTAGDGISIANGVISTTAKYVYNNSYPQSTNWRIEHNLNYYPKVLVIDSSGREVECGVRYESPNVCIVEMNNLIAGTAYLS